MLDKVDSPLTNTQISTLFLEQDYTDYFQIQQILNDLSDTKLLRMKVTPDNTQYSITAAGRKTLDFLRDKLPDAIERDTLAYLKKYHLMPQNSSASASYSQAPDAGYAVRCQVRERGCDFMDLTLMVKNEEQAKAICSNWKTQNKNIYAYLMDHLMN